MGEGPCLGAKGWTRSLKTPTVCQAGALAVQGEGR